MTANSREERQHSPKKADDQRKEFQIDRDRIIYSTAFRRLAQVTQVVSASEGSVFHNRLTHSLKVAQVGRRLAEKLIQDASTNPELIEKCGGLDPDVVEAAALAHDLGHPPFGHIAEKELNQLARKYGLSDGFEGNAQTFRILTRLEPHRKDYPGLNLTRATLNATLKYPWFCHRDSGDTKTRKRAKKYSVYDLDRKSFDFVRRPIETEASIEQQTLEASIMDFADDVTYSVHDLEDFYLAGLIPLHTLGTNKVEFNQFIKKWRDSLPDSYIKEQLESINTETLEEEDEEKGLKGRLKRFLYNYYIENYTPGFIEQIKRGSSVLIQQYIQSVSLRDSYGEYGYLERDKDKEIELQFLQQIVRKYVIDNPRLTTQQFGQRKIVGTLFEIYKEAIETERINLIPVRFLKDGSFQGFLDTENKKTIEQQKVRMAIDIVASFSEFEAVTMYRRLAGMDQGSVMDYII